MHPVMSTYKSAVCYEALPEKPQNIFSDENLKDLFC